VLAVSGSVTHSLTYSFVATEILCYGAFCTPDTTLFLSSEWFDQRQLQDTEGIPTNQPLTAHATEKKHPSVARASRDST